MTLERLPDGLFLERVQVFTADLAKRSVRLRFLFGGDVADGPAEVALAFDKGEESKLTLDVRDGAAEALLTVPGGQVWSPASPHLHTLTAACRSDAVVEQNRRMIRSGINNPCVIFWSFLNEAANDEPGAVPLYETAVAEIRREDPSRLVFVGNASNTGGIAGDSGSVSYKFVNCLMAENNSRTTTGGGGLLRGSSVFVNCTIVSNRHASTSLGMVQGTCTNVLFHGNTRYDLSSATAVNCLYHGTIAWPWRSRASAFVLVLVLVLAPRRLRYGVCRLFPRAGQSGNQEGRKGRVSLPNFLPSCFPDSRRTESR